MSQISTNAPANLKPILEEIVKLREDMNVRFETVEKSLSILRDEALQGFIQVNQRIQDLGRNNPPV